MGDMERAIAWFKAREGVVTYSMYSRNGPSSYDCSSSIYFALKQAGIFPESLRIGNTESMFNELPQYGFTRVGLNAQGGYDAMRGDIFIWGTRGASNGAAGHTGIFVDPDNIIHCNYGYNGISVNNHDWIHSLNGSPTNTIYRYTGGVASAAVVDSTDSRLSAPVSTVDVPSTDWFDLATKKDLEDVIFNTPRPEFNGRTLAAIVREVDKNTWGSKKMVWHLFDLYRIGIPGVLTDGPLAPVLRRLFKYDEGRLGKLRNKGYQEASKRDFNV